MKKSLFFLFNALWVFSVLQAQAPAGYYNGTENLSGYALKTKLSSIITYGHYDQGYNGLHAGYPSTDADTYYEDDGTVLDMYSENPDGTDPYNFTFSYDDRCGNYSNEGDCYNREHLVPQSIFDQNYPMRSDIHHVVPTDGKVNGYRSNFPFGEVSNAYITSENGSKKGSCVSTGFNGTCFEPIDEFKGDIARMVLYFVTRYENSLSGFDTSNGMLDGSRNQGLTDWELEVMLDWHQQDPVSQREIDRNNAAYNFQGNRNPYIDNPDWVWAIWDPSRLGLEEVTDLEGFIVYPNPVKNNKVFVKGKALDQVKNLKIFNMQGQLVKEVDHPFVKGNVVNLQGLPTGMYLLKIGQNVEKIMID